MNITDLPYNRFIGIERTFPEGALSLPKDLRYTNHLGTVHAGALLSLAEAASGEYLIGILEGLGFEVIPVVRRLEAKFRKPAQGAISAKAAVEEGARDVFLKALRDKGRALIEIPVGVQDEAGAQALFAVVEWFVARK